MSSGQVEAFIEPKTSVKNDSDDLIIEDITHEETPEISTPKPTQTPEDITKIFHNFLPEESLPVENTPSISIHTHPAGSNPYAQSNPYHQGNMNYGQPYKKAPNQVVENDINIPAYVRRNIQLATAPPSNSSNVERLSISQKKEEPNEPTFQFTPNKMLHDNVD
jgi:hypothetical protein